MATSLGRFVRPRFDKDSRSALTLRSPIKYRQLIARNALDNAAIYDIV
jgi:hypothetical protein